MTEQETRDYHRQKVVEAAVGTADRIILDGSDGSVEETNYLTAMVAEKFMKKALIPHHSAMMRKDQEKL